MAQAIPFIIAGMTLLTANQQLKAGKAEASGLARQAAFKKVQARSEVLKFKQQGIAVMDNILATKAAINARAAAGGIDPFSGSANALALYAEKKGANELYINRDGEQIAFGIGEAQAMQYMSQAKSAISASRAQALGTIMQGAMMGMSLGGAPAGAGGSTGLQAGQSATTARAGFRGYGG